MRTLVAAILLLLLLPGCGRLQPGGTEVVVSAAASLTGVLTEARLEFEAITPGTKIRLNLGSSGSLQQQIEQGAPVDLFISAAPGPMAQLVSKGLVEQSAVANLATNKLVLVRGKTSPVLLSSWEDLTGEPVRKIAIGNPAHVPAGQYGKAALEKLGLWDALQPKLVLGEDVRQVLNFVERGEAQAGLVYASDAAGQVVVAEAPPGSYPPVVYPMAVLKEARQAGQARAFADFLRSERGKAILTKYGFGVVE